MGHSKKSRNRRSAPAAAVAPAGVPASYWGNNYQGASVTTDRGYVPWSTIDTREELSNFERGELLRRIHWLKAHFGFVRGLIRNSADLVGWQTPQALSGDEEWDDAAEAYFRDCCGEASAFDVAGKFDFEDAQPMLMRAAFTDAHIFTVLTKWDDGNPRFAFYEAAALRNPKDAGKEWRDGIKVAKSGRHLAYGFYDHGLDKVIEIPAASVIYFGEFDSPGQDAPVPPLAHAVNHSVDITEVWGFQKKATKLTSLGGAVIETDAAAKPPAGRQAFIGAPSTVTNANGEKFQNANVYGGGQIPALQPGQKMNILKDDRPSANQRQLVLDLKRDIASGFGLPVEVIDEMFSLTGPGIRYIMDFAGNWIRCRQKRQKVWLRQVWRYTIACGIANGRLGLPKSKDGKKGQWWVVGFTGQRLLTIDRGKESRARLDEIDAGVGTWENWGEIDGMDWKDRTKQRVAEVAYAQQLCEEKGVDFARAFPPRQGSAAPAEAEESTPPPKDKPSKE